MKTSLTLAVAAALLSAAIPAAGANLSVNPSVISLSLPPGSSASTLAGVAVNSPPPTPYVVVVQLRAAGGSLPAGWVASPAKTITSAGGPQQLPLIFSIPASAAAGTYTAQLQPVVLSSTIPLGPASRIVATVTVVANCPGPPTVVLDAAGAVELWPPNGRLEDASFTGRVVVPSGCGLTRAWYVLEDEYGLFGGGGEVLPAAGGSYALTVPLQVSRRGDDADGRAYRLTVYAQDEAGVGASPPVDLTVGHDRRK